MKRLDQVFAIGPLYAEQFERNGIRTVADLAGAQDLESLSVRTTIPLDSIQQWHRIASQKIRTARYRNRVILVLAAVVAVALILEVRTFYQAPDANAQGEQLYGEGKYTEALAQFEKAVKFNELSARAHANKGSALRMLGRCAEAQPELAKAVQLNQKYSWAYVEQGACYSNLGEFDQAMKSFKTAEDIDSSNQYAHGLAGSSLRRQKRYPEALAELDAAIKMDTNYVWAYNERAHVFWDQEKYDLAIRDFNLALELDPNYKWAYAKAGPLRALGKYQESLDALNQALSIDPEWMWAYEERGSLYHDNLFQFEPAYQDLQKAIGLGDTESAADMAEAALTAGRYPEAYDRARKLVVGSGDKDADKADVSDQCTARFIAISALLLQGKNDQAKVELQDFIQYYRSASARFQPHWNYSGTQHFVNGQTMDGASKTLILDLIKLLQVKPTVKIQQIEGLVASLK